MAGCVDRIPGSIWGLLLIVVVLGGIYTGAFTPTEAAAVSAVYAFVIAVFVYRDLKLADVPRVLLASANMSAMILLLHYHERRTVLVPNDQRANSPGNHRLGHRIGHRVDEFLLFVNILLLLAGNVMEPSSIVLITAPILFPVAIGLGINPIHLGILMTVNMGGRPLPSTGDLIFTWPLASRVWALPILRSQPFPGW